MLPLFSDGFDGGPQHDFQFRSVVSNEPNLRGPFKFPEILRPQRVQGFLRKDVVLGKSVYVFDAGSFHLYELVPV